MRLKVNHFKLLFLSMNEVTNFQGFCDNSTEAFIIKMLTVGVKNCPKLRDVMYSRPQNKTTLTNYVYEYLCLNGNIRIEANNFFEKMQK
jgi:hypothetical protein